MATAVGAYATLSLAKTRLGITDTLDDTMLQSACDQANMWVERKTNRILVPYTAFSSTVSSGFAAGSQTGVVGIATGLNVEDVLMFGPVTGTHESALVTAISSNTISLATPLQSGYASGVTAKRVYIYDGFNALESDKMFPLPLGVVSVTSLEVCTFSAGQGGSTGANVIWYQIPGFDFNLRPQLQQRTPGWPATELWITNVPQPSDLTPSYYPGLNNIRLDAQLGWPAMPDDIVDVALNIAVAIYRARSSTGGEVLHTGTDGASVINRALTYENKLTIAAYSTHHMSVI